MSGKLEIQWVIPNQGPHKALKLTKENFQEFLRFLGRNLLPEGFGLSIHVTPSGEYTGIQVSYPSGNSFMLIRVGEIMVWEKGEFISTVNVLPEKSFLNQWIVVKQGSPWSPYLYNQPTEVQDGKKTTDQR